VLEVKRQLGIPDNLPNISLVNDKQATHETVMREGETLSLFLPLAGGMTASDNISRERCGQE
jgi:hypothetical protein